jgi:hypothetical protein
MRFVSKTRLPSGYGCLTFAELSATTLEVSNVGLEVISWVLPD